MKKFTPQERWDKSTVYELNMFLSKNGFHLGWSAHTWKQLDRKIQSCFEMYFI